MSAAVASTAVGTATTAAVITAIAMVAATRVAAVVSVIPAAIATADEAMGVSASVAVSPASIVSIMAIVAAMSVVTATTVEAAAIVTAVVPRSGADEDAAGEVVRSVEAVWSAGVRIVAEVTISAGWRWSDGAVHGTYSNAHGKLCVSVSRGKKQNTEQSNVF
jgi:hypothetical protein